MNAPARAFTTGGRRNPFAKAVVADEPRPGEPGAVAGVVDAVRRAGDEVLPLGRGRFLVERRPFDLDGLIALANARAARAGRAALAVPDADRAACAGSAPVAAYSELLGGKPRRSGVKFWTAARDKILAQMWNAGKSRPAIVAALGCSRTAIDHRRRRLGLSQRPRNWGAVAYRAVFRP